MKTSFVFIIAILPMMLSAQTHNMKAPLIDHMCTVNKAWSEYTELLPATAHSVQFKSEADRIKMHLLLVTQQLHESQPNLEPGQAANRQDLLNVLEVYAERAQFPKNLYHINRQPYFIDAFGTHCAVGFLIQQSGYASLAQTIHRENNYAYIDELNEHYPQLREWAVSHGFTLAELALIQPGYPPEENWQALGGGANGPVENLCSWNGGIVLSVDFTVIGETACEGLAYWDGQSYSCLPEPSGVVNDVSANGRDLYIYGSFAHNGQPYDMAKLEADQWIYRKVLKGDSSVITKMLSDDDWALAGHYFQDGTKKHTLFTYHKQSATHTEVATFNGAVNGYHHYSDSIAIGGAFTHINDTTPISYLGIYAGGDLENIRQMHAGQLNSPVLDIEKYSKSLFVSAAISDTLNQRKFGLAQYFKGRWRILLDYRDFLSDSTSFINNLYVHDDDIYVTGRFSIQPPIGTYGKNLGLVSLKEPLSLNSIGSFDAPVTDILVHDQFVILSGSFKKQLWHSVPYIAYLDQSPTVDVEMPVTSAISVFPNPSSHVFTIKWPSDLDGEDYLLQVRNVNGQLMNLQMHRTSNQIAIDAHTWPSGIYSYRLINENGTVGSGRLVKR